jgi:hypothetical protein
MHVIHHTPTAEIATQADSGDEFDSSDHLHMDDELDQIIFSDTEEASFEAEEQLILENLTLTEQLQVMEAQLTKATISVDATAKALRKQVGLRMQEEKRAAKLQLELDSMSQEHAQALATLKDYYETMLLNSKSRYDHSLTLLSQEADHQRRKSARLQTQLDQTLWTSDQQARAETLALQDAFTALLHAESKVEVEALGQQFVSQAQDRVEFKRFSAAADWLGRIERCCRSRCLSVMALMSLLYRQLEATRGSPLMILALAYIAQ